MTVNTALLFFFFFFIYSLVLSTLFLIGETTFRIVRIKSVFSYGAIIRNIFLGYILTITLYSIANTHFVTLNLVYIFLLGCALYELSGNRERIVQLVKMEEKLNPFLLLVMALAVFSWSWFSIVNIESEIGFDFFGDNILYSKISRALTNTGNENGFYFLNNFDSFYHGCEPYHYFDVWGGAMVASFFQINHYLTLQLVIYPIFYFLFMISLFFLVEGKRTYIHVLVCSLLLFLSGMYLSFYEEVPFLGLLRNFSFNLLSPWMNKLSFFYVFIIISYHLYANNLKSFSILCLLGLTVARHYQFACPCNFRDIDYWTSILFQD